LPEVIVHSHDGKFQRNAIAKNRLVGFPVGSEWRAMWDESFMMSNSVRTRWVGVAINVGFPHDVEADSDTVRRRGVLRRNPS
jgi:hypothetical protein